MSKIKDRCEEKLRPIIEDLGYELIEVNYQKVAGEMNLIFTIDSDTPITIDDCEKVTKAIDPILEEMNPTDDSPYILSVSSPGIDRPLKSKRDFDRNIGKEIEISLFKKLENKKTFIGILDNYDENSITIIQEEKPVIIKRELIAHIVPVIKV